MLYKVGNLLLSYVSHTFLPMASVSNTGLVLTRNMAAKVTQSNSITNVPHSSVPLNTDPVPCVSSTDTDVLLVNTTVNESHGANLVDSTPTPEKLPVPVSSHSHSHFEHDISPITTSSATTQLQENPQTFHSQNIQNSNHLNSTFISFDESNPFHTTNPFYSSYTHANGQKAHDSERLQPPLSAPASLRSSKSYESKQSDLNHVSQLHPSSVSFSTFPTSPPPSRVPPPLPPFSFPTSTAISTDEKLDRILNLFESSILTPGFGEQVRPIADKKWTSLFCCFRATRTPLGL